MPVHKIEMSQPSRTVLHSDITFGVYSAGKKLGSVRISKGTIDWASSRSRSFKKITWKRFASIMNNA